MLRHASGGSDHELLSGKLQTEPPPICRSFTIVLLSNVRTDTLSRIKADLAAMVFGEKYETSAERATTRPDPKLVSQYVGRDSVSPKMVVTVTSEDGALDRLLWGGFYKCQKID